MKHSNIAIFIPHMGCPNKCSFCNQNTITGFLKAPTTSEVENEIKSALKNEHLVKSDVQIAFFGGSFTAIDRDYMVSLLKIASKFVKDYNLAGVRISTRPDCIDDEILNILKRYSVTSIELGAQSIVDDVLRKNFRGHTVSDVIKASNLIKENGFELGLQMMIGLYGDSKENAIKTANEIIKIKPDTVRIYPTVVLKETYLEKLYNEGKYNIFSLEESVDICADLLQLFEKNHIKVIKLGLHSSLDVEKNMVAGIYHQAFRELCESKIYYKKAKEVIKNSNFEKNSNLIINVSQKSISKMIGQKKNNIIKLKNDGYNVKIIPNNTLKEYEIKIFKN